MGCVCHILRWPRSIEQIRVDQGQAKLSRGGGGGNLASGTWKPKPALRDKEIPKRRRTQTLSEADHPGDVDQDQQGKLYALPETDLKDHSLSILFPDLLKVLEQMIEIICLSTKEAILQQYSKDTGSSVTASSIESHVLIASQELPDLPVSNPSDFEASEDQNDFIDIDGSVQMEVFRRVIEKQKPQYPDLKKRIDRHKKEGKGFGEIRALFPDLRTDMFTRIYDATDESSSSGTIKDNHRVFEMLGPDGLLHTWDFSFLGRRHNWNFESSHKAEDGNPQPWYQDKSEPGLCI